MSPDKITWPRPDRVYTELDPDGAKAVRAARAAVRLALPGAGLTLVNEWRRVFYGASGWSLPAHSPVFADVSDRVHLRDSGCYLLACLTAADLPWTHLHTAMRAGVDRLPMADREHPVLTAAHGVAALLVAQHVAAADDLIDMVRDLYADDIKTHWDRYFSARAAYWKQRDEEKAYAA